MADDDILVLGATGTVGRRVARLLEAGGAPVRAASRSGAVRFDWEDRGTWEPAVAGASAMFLMAPDGVPVDAGFVTLAVGAGVRRLVLLSSRAVDAMGDERLLAAESAVRGCGAAWTVVRADWYFQNFDEGFFRDAVLAGELALPVGEVRQAFVDAGDVAAVAAAALTGDGHAGRVYEVTGPQALSFREALAVVGDAAGRRVRFRGDPADYRAAMTALGLPAEAVEGEIASFAALRALGDATPTGTVREVTGRPATPLASYAAEAAARGAWSTPPAG